jgi:Ni,Fe-hydrogenase III small subunit
MKVSTGTHREANHVVKTVAVTKRMVKPLKTMYRDMHDSKMSVKSSFSSKLGSNAGKFLYKLKINQLRKK